jgi:hypothetical protein
MAIDPTLDIGVDCDGCGTHANVDVSNVVHERMQQRDWEMGGQHGDLCPECVEKHDGQI